MDEINPGALERFAFMPENPYDILGKVFALGIGLVLYSAWYYTKMEFLNIAAFIVLIVGALYVWYRQT